MPPLKNIKHEKFAQEIVKGSSGSSAYMAAGFKAKTVNVARVGASQLLMKPNVSGRINELRAKLADEFAVTQEKIVRELAKMAFSDIRSVVKWGDGVAIKNPETGEALVVNDVVLIGSEHLDDAAAGGIAEVSQSPNGGLKVKMHDKRAALVDLGKHLGLFDGAGRDPDEFIDPLPNLSDGQALVLLERITKERVLVKRK